VFKESVLRTLVFWYVVLCSGVNRSWRFSVTQCLQIWDVLTPPHRMTSQETNVLKISAVTTSNLGQR